VSGVRVACINQPHLSEHAKCVTRAQTGKSETAAEEPLRAHASDAMMGSTNWGLANGTARVTLALSVLLAPSSPVVTEHLWESVFLVRRVFSPRPLARPSATLADRAQRAARTE